MPWRSPAPARRLATGCPPPMPASSPRTSWSCPGCPPRPACSFRYRRRARCATGGSWSAPSECRSPAGRPPCSSWPMTGIPVPACEPASSTRPRRRSSRAPTWLASRAIPCSSMARGRPRWPPPTAESGTSCTAPGPWPARARSRPRPSACWTWRPATAASGASSGVSWRNSRRSSSSSRCWPPRRWPLAPRCSERWPCWGRACGRWSRSRLRRCARAWPPPPPPGSPISCTARSASPRSTPCTGSPCQPGPGARSTAPSGTGPQLSSPTVAPSMAIPHHRPLTPHP